LGLKWAAIPLQDTLELGGVDDVDGDAHVQLLLGEVEVDQSDLGVLDPLGHGCSKSKTKTI
jgi:hypothetical protein